MSLLTACLDSNVIISGIAFRGKPFKILERALDREFHLVLGPPIVDEVCRNLVGKLVIKRSSADAIMEELLAVASICIPGQGEEATPNKGDNLVLEISLMGQCDVLVTGDKKHLLPLSPYKGLIIEPPSRFLDRLDRQRPDK